MTFSQYLHAIRARWFLASFVAIFVIAVTWGASTQWPKSYTATAALLVDVKTADPLGGGPLGAALPPPVLQSYLATQIQIILSERTAMKVVRELKLDQDSKVRALWQTATKGQGVFEVWLVDWLRKQLEVKPSRDSHLITITATGATANFAADLANAFSQASLRTDLEVKSRPARESADFFDERTKASREQLESAQAKLSALQRKYGFTGSDERIDVENARLQELSTQLTLVQTLSVESGSRQREAQRGDPGSIPEVLANPVVQSLKGELTRTEGKLQELATQYGPNHPLYQRTQNEVIELRSRLTSEMANVARSLGSTSRVNQNREAELRVAVEAQRARVLALRRSRDEVGMLQRDVDNAQKQFESLSQRRVQTNMESRSTLSPLSILAPAVEPLRHTSPNLLLNMMIATFAGVLLGVVAAILREGSDRRVRSADDLSTMLEFPMLATIEPSRSSGRSSGGGNAGLLTGPAASG